MHEQVCICSVSRKMSWFLDYSDDSEDGAVGGYVSLWSETR